MKVAASASKPAAPRLGRGHRFFAQVAAAAALPSRGRKTLGAWQRLARGWDHVARVQGGCYLVMGMWPLTHMASLEQVTGPKHDAWLMQTAGALLAVVGVVLILGSSKRTMGPIVALLGAGIAGVLAALAAAFVALGHIRPVYLLDVALEAGFVAWWAYASIAPRPRRRRSRLTKRASAQDALMFTAYLTPAQRATRH